MIRKKSTLPAVAARDSSVGRSSDGWEFDSASRPSAKMRVSIASSRLCAGPRISDCDGYHQKIKDYQWSQCINVYQWRLWDAHHMQ